MSDRDNELLRGALDAAAEVLLAAEAAGGPVNLGELAELIRGLSADEVMACMSRAEKETR